MSVLLSFPRSGNHLVRFFIELLTEKPTLGITINDKDIPIYQNTFPEDVPFNIKELSSYNKDELYVKWHQVPKTNPETLIFIVRNPREVLLRHHDYKFVNSGWCCYDSYFRSVEYFENFKGKKICFYYEDIIIDKQNFIEELYTFLGCENESKKEYVLNNIEKLYNLSCLGENRLWAGVKSSGAVNFYYEKISGKDKERFDNYIENKMRTGKYGVLRDKYAL
jgi:hypothetical protein